ncbi:hypothetical protein AQ490_09175 [Wenjunlia vitaminophila]|uniref:Low molecular weight protein antigen 6 PH domain-containing protein n=1 Tax=Wenjunlia vitaminophila TaxID=76728 RepID=A0A0T6LLJ2_WENVI|nr:PH domain-containing protein [Wenjunlia vitaminophila]KRV46934.1 hypothetical protein AQ490_09175 [Wenjunlia vitaminophila]
MTSPDNRPGTPTPEPVYAARSYRSTSGIITGVLLLAVGGWLVGDAVLHGEGRVPWLALASLLMIAPVVVAFTLRPAVFASEERMVVRNPFRTITLPWSVVADLRSAYTVEALTEDRKYQLWAVPVSMRQRKRASRNQVRAATEDPYGRTTTSAFSRGALHSPTKAWSDTAVDELRETLERNRDRPEAAGEAVVRWAFEVIGPTLAGAAVLAVLLAAT